MKPLAIVFSKLLAANPGHLPLSLTLTGLHRPGTRLSARAELLAASDVAERSKSSAGTKPVGDSPADLQPVQPPHDPPAPTDCADRHACAARRTTTATDIRIIAPTITDCHIALIPCPVGFPIHSVPCIGNNLPPALPPPEVPSALRTEAPTSVSRLVGQAARRSAPVASHMVNHPCSKIRKRRHIDKCEERPFPAVGFTPQNHQCRTALGAEGEEHEQ